jgi:cbb3-type cytochrome oxidase maturation protein
MNVLLLLVPLSLMLLVLIICAFVWAVRNGQFEDLDTPPLEILSDSVTDTRVSTPASDHCDER